MKLFWFLGEQSRYVERYLEMCMRDKADRHRDRHRNRDWWIFERVCRLLYKGKNQRRAIEIHVKKRIQAFKNPETCAFNGLEYIFGSGIRGS